MNSNERLGAKMRSLRLAAGLTQAQVASAVGMDRTHYAHLEAGRNSVSSARLKPLASALGVTAGDLVASALDEQPTTHDQPPTGLMLLWTFGRHTFRLHADRSAGQVLVMVSCNCRSEVIWQKSLDGTDPLAALGLRTDSTIADQISNHLLEVGEPAGERFKVEAFLLALSSGAEVFALLDRMSDESQVIPRGALEK